MDAAVVGPGRTGGVFDAGSHLHLAMGARGWLLDHIDVILGTIEVPDFRQDDPAPGRERFYRADFPAPGRWLRVVIDFNDTPGWAVTALDTHDAAPQVLAAAA